ncbi:kinase-like domain-containing protein [Hyaloraphidium curvatum]|nr:kinase-like domain-containing protein [Hyaloraphidium curvatum]
MGIGQELNAVMSVPIDVSSLLEFLRPLVPGLTGPLAAKQFSMGLTNPKYLITDTSTGIRLVVKRKPDAAALVASAHQVDREFRVLAACARAPVPPPVPRVYALCEDDRVLGKAFFAMDFVPGRVFSVAEHMLPGVSPPDRREIIFDLLRSVAKLHAIDPVAVGLYGLKGFRNRGNGYGRLMRTWIGAGEDYTRFIRERDDPASAAQWTIRGRDELLAWLRRNQAADEVAIMHGDCGLHNTILHPTEPRVLAMIDWENATISHPLADVALIAGMYEFPQEPPPEGIPSLEEMLRVYCAAAGRPYPIPGFDFCLVWDAFKTMCQLQGVRARALDPAQRSAQYDQEEPFFLSFFRHKNEVALRIAGIRLEGGDGSRL